MDFTQFSYSNERLNNMREILRNLNKASLAAATGISYSRLRKYASGILNTLTDEECQKICDYLYSLAKQCEHQKE